MKLPFVGQIPGRVVDERFLEHRRRSTSLGGIVAAIWALGLFEYHVWRQHVWNWELLSIPVAMAVVKLFAMAWYHFTD